MKALMLFWVCIFLSACSTQTNYSLHQRIGGQSVIEDIAENFVSQIASDERILPYFAKSSVSRFKTQFATHLCAVTDGDCVYSGDDMKRVHDGMNIDEGDFNHTVALLLQAMEDAGVSVGLQNEVIARLAPLRKDIIYR